MNRLLQLRSELISSNEFDGHELNTILFGEDYKYRNLAWEVVKDNQALQDHYHLQNYSLEEIRNKALKKLAVSWRHTPDLEEVKKLNL